MSAEQQENAAFGRLLTDMMQEIRDADVAFKGIGTASSMTNVIELPNGEEWEIVVSRYNEGANN